MAGGRPYHRPLREWSRFGLLPTGCARQKRNPANACSELTASRRMNKLRLNQILAAGFLLCALAGCASISGKLPPPSPPVATGEFRVGAAKVDITPMPGFPMGGYSAAGRISRGVWMRLHARAVCFEDAEGHSLALVSADLWAVPAGFADRVAELLSRDHGCRARPAPRGKSRRTGCAPGRCGILRGSPHGDGCSHGSL